MKIDLSKVVAYPISVIQLLKPVLDDAYERIEGSEKEKDAAINKAIAYFVREYKDLRDGDDIDYSPAAHRYAYLLRYVTAHANIVVEIVERSEELQELFDRDELEVASIGGGPGSEVVALTKYAAEHKKKTTLNFHLYDCDNAWADTWSKLHKRVSLPVKMFPMFKHLDACKKDTWKQDALKEADLITMVFFCSEVFKHADDAAPFFKKLFKGAKKGALILYVDNSGGGFTEWFDSLTKDCGLEILAGRAEDLINVPYGEEKKDFGQHFEKFGAPKIRSQVAWGVLRKK